jgi:hypothetical protein
MKEDFLHYLWKFKKFDSTNLHAFNGESISIIDCGQYLKFSGPDFFNARIEIGGQKWAGNVEIHLKSSDWYLHHHEIDAAYESVILHVVWEHDTEIFRKNNTEIPVLELRHYVSADTIANYQALSAPKSWIFCERQLKDIDSFVLDSWLERLFFERLESKSGPIIHLLSAFENDWEAVLFCILAKNFGLNTNGDAFLKIARSIPFIAIRKEAGEPENLEALLMGFAGLLEAEKEDVYYKRLKTVYDFLVHKYRLEKAPVASVEFFQHRPDNFPTIRLAQLAQLYHMESNLFSKIVSAATIAELHAIFKVDVSEYWRSHYQFDKLSPEKRKPLSTSFINLLLVNSVIPIRFAYAKSVGKDVSEDLIALTVELESEKNAVIDKFASFGIKSKSAFDSQSLLQLKNDYCAKGRCLDCAIGMELLKSEGSQNALDAEPP